MNNGGSCNTDMYNGNIPSLDYTQLDLEYSPAPATGACAGSATQNATTVNYSGQDRACTPSTPPCTGGECRPVGWTGFQVCIEIAGPASCPGTTFTQLHQVETGASVTCGTGCSCNWAATCTGTMKLFTMSGCSGSEYDIPADGTCHAHNTSHGQFTSYQYAGNAPSGVACNATGSSTPQVNLTGEETICCAP